jgi:hypothetical protein
MKKKPKTEDINYALSQCGKCSKRLRCPAQVGDINPKTFECFAFDEQTTHLLTY